MASVPEIKVVCVTRKKPEESKKKLQGLQSKGWRLVSVDQEVAYLERRVGRVEPEVVLPKNPCQKCMSGWISISEGNGLVSCHDGCEAFRELMELLGREF